MTAIHSTFGSFLHPPCNYVLHCCAVVLLLFLQGYVSPQVEPGAAAAVFAVYDNHQKLQYIGFSKDLQASLRTVLGRRPDKAFFFK